MGGINGGGAKVDAGPGKGPAMLYGQSSFPAPRWLGRRTTSPGIVIAFSWRSCLLQLVGYPELRKPADKTNLEKELNR